MSVSHERLNRSPRVLRWARERADFSIVDLAEKMGVKPDRVSSWEESGDITVAQVDKLSHYTHTPLGFLFLAEPPEDRLPVTDFRTLGDRSPRPSPDLLETVQSMQRRVSWMREDLLEEGADPLKFVGSSRTDETVETIVCSMRDALGLEYDWAEEKETWGEALRYLRVLLEDAGVLVVFNGVVGNNSHRKLSVQEFRGFALVDDYAPLIFVNGADSKSAQMFTLAHELAHVFIGASGVSIIDPLQPSTNSLERLCNAVAAEFLVPESEFRPYWDTLPRNAERIPLTARHFKVSSVVAARRALELGLIEHETLAGFYLRFQGADQKSSRNTGGDFWNNQNVRVGRKFGAAVVRAVSEGRLLYREAYLLTGLKGKTFDKFVKKIAAPS
jgi:Zn-dependent peptidase ImmA (M78 family)